MLFRSEISNQIIIAGPADVSVAPVAGATLVITYKKEPNGIEEATPTPTPIPIVSPTPGGTATPGATPSPTPTP